MHLLKLTFRLFHPLVFAFHHFAQGFRRFVAVAVFYSFVFHALLAIDIRQQIYNISPT